MKKNLKAAPKAVNVNRLMQSLIERNPDMDQETFKDTMHRAMVVDESLKEAFIEHVFDRLCDLADKRASGEALTDCEAEFLDHSIHFWSTQRDPDGQLIFQRLTREQLTPDRGGNAQ